MRCTEVFSEERARSVSLDDLKIVESAKSVGLRGPACPLGLGHFSSGSTDVGKEYVALADALIEASPRIAVNIVTAEVGRGDSLVVPNVI